MKLNTSIATNDTNAIAIEFLKIIEKITNGAKLILKIMLKVYIKSLKLNLKQYY